MSPWSSITAILLVLILLVPATMGQECQDQVGCDDGDAAGEESPSDGTSEANQTSGRGNADPPRAAPERDVRAEERSRRAQDSADRTDEWRETLQERLDAADQARRAALIDRLPVELRDRLGLLRADDGRIEGRYVSFEPNGRLGMLNDVRAEETPIFVELYAPLELGAEVQVQAKGNTFAAEGEDWRLRISDHPAVPMHFVTHGETFLLILPADATARATHYGFDITYADGQVARLAGAVEQDPADAQALTIDGSATYHLSAAREALPLVANKMRPQIESALAGGRVGAEMTLLTTTDGDLVADTVTYEDLELLLDSGTVDDPETEGAYTITVDSESQTGKTLVVNLESGMVDPDSLAFRYFNVHGDRVVEAPIRIADGIEDVLDPLDDGTVAEYWIVEDADGTQVLLSVPHFSVHRIELQSVVDVVLERPSLLLGTLGAVALVGVATARMFRRPQDTL